MKETPRDSNSSRKRKQSSFLCRRLINSLPFLSRFIVEGITRRKRRRRCKTNFLFYIHCARLIFIDSASGIQLENRLTSITIPGAPLLGRTSKMHIRGCARIYRGRIEDIGKGRKRGKCIVARGDRQLDSITSNTRR